MAIELLETNIALFLVGGCAKRIGMIGCSVRLCFDKLYIEPYKFVIDRYYIIAAVVLQRNAAMNAKQSD